MPHRGAVNRWDQKRLWKPILWFDAGPLISSQVTHGYRSGPAAALTLHVPLRFGHARQEVSATLAKEASEKSQARFVYECVVADAGQLVLQPSQGVLRGLFVKVSRNIEKTAGPGLLDLFGS